MLKTSASEEKSQKTPSSKAEVGRQQVSVYRHVKLALSPYREPIRPEGNPIAQHTPNTAKCIALTWPYIPH